MSYTTMRMCAYWFSHLGWREGLACWPPVAWSWCFWRWDAASPPQPPDPGSPVAPWGLWSGAEEQQREDGQLPFLWFLPAVCVSSLSMKSPEMGTIHPFLHFACSTPQISLQMSQRPLIPLQVFVPSSEMNQLLSPSTHVEVLEKPAGKSHWPLPKAVRGQITLFFMGMMN